MKSKTLMTLLSIILIILANTAILSADDNGEEVEMPEHVVVFALDGFRPDYLAMYQLPTLEGLVENGVFYAKATGIFPSTTTTNHTSLVTGAYPAATGIPNNAKYDRDLDRIVSPLRDVKVPVISEILKEQGKTTVVLSHFMLQNRGEEAYLEKGVDSFKQAFKQYNPDLLVYYEVESDSFGHKYGPYSKMMKKKLEEIDAEIGEMIAFLKEEGIKEKTAIIVVSDHGMSENVEPGVALGFDDRLEKAGFKLAFSNEEISEETDIVIIPSGCAFLYLRNGRIDEEEYNKLMAILKTIPHIDIYTEAEMKELHVDPEGLGDIVLVPHEGYSIFGGSGGGIHGRPEESQITLILSGTGIEKGAIKGNASIIDVTPTILELLGLEIPETVQGEVLKGAIIQQPIDWSTHF
jgi:predicted AlkP superfamily pyrophosphatase or phosphodiesterase